MAGGAPGRARGEGRRGGGGLAERGWEGRAIRAGIVRIGFDSLRARCVMTTFDPDSLAQDPGILRDIQSVFGGRLALNAYVIEEGPVALGDPVTLLNRED